MEKELIEFIAKKLVDDPNQVDVKIGRKINRNRASNCT